MGVGKQNTGDALAQDVSGRFGGYFATTAALTALPASKRTDGMVVAVGAGNVLWTFAAASSASATSRILVPDSGSGRWLCAGGSTMKVSVVAGQNEATPAITVTGIAAADELVAFIVMASGVPTARALTDFTLSANTITVGANAANNAANKYLVYWNDLT